MDRVDGISAALRHTPNLTGDERYGRGLGCPMTSDITPKQIAAARAMVNKGNNIEA
jgi:hypothetical protein